MVIQHLNSSTLGHQTWSRCLEIRNLEPCQVEIIEGKLQTKVNVSKLIVNTPYINQEPTNISFQGACISNLIYELKSTKLLLGIS